MPTNRFGELNTQPLYNATGRLERGESVPRQEWTSPNAGVSKNFGATTPYPSQAINPAVQELANPWSYTNLRLMPDPDRPSRGGGGGSRGMGGDGVGGNVYNINLDQSAQFATQSQFDQSAQGMPTAPSSPAKPARTPQQRAQTASIRAQKKAANPAYGTKNPNRTQAPKKPRQAKTPTPAGAVAKNNQASANQINSPTASPASMQPGAGFLQFSGVGNINR